MPELLQGYLYALPNKLLHSPVSNARPLLNTTTVWKLVAMVIAAHYLPLLCKQGVIPLTQFDLHKKSSAVDLLRVLRPPRGGRLPTVLMRPPPSYLSKLGLQLVRCGPAT